MTHIFTKLLRDGEEFGIDFTKINDRCFIGCWDGSKQYVPESWLEFFDEGSYYHYEVTKEVGNAFYKNVITKGYKVVTRRTSNF